MPLTARGKKSPTSETKAIHFDFFKSVSLKKVANSCPELTQLSRSFSQPGPEPLEELSSQSSSRSISRSISVGSIEVELEVGKWYETADMEDAPVRSTEYKELTAPPPNKKPCK